MGTTSPRRRKRNRFRKATPTEAWKTQIKIRTITLQNSLINFEKPSVTRISMPDFSRIGGRISGLSSIDENQRHGPSRENTTTPCLPKSRAKSVRSGNCHRGPKSLCQRWISAPYRPIQENSWATESKRIVQPWISMPDRQPQAPVGKRNTVINKVTLGDKVEGPESRRKLLPISLAIALFESRNRGNQPGRPVTEALTIQSSASSSLVLQVLGNLIAEAVTSPSHSLATS